MRLGPPRCSVDDHVGHNRNPVEHMPSKRVGNGHPYGGRGCALNRFADAYKVKYEFRPDLTDDTTVTYTLAPRVVFAWMEANFPQTATRWVIPES